MFVKAKKLFKSSVSPASHYEDVKLKSKKLKSKRGSCQNDGCNDGCDDGCGRSMCCGCC